MPDNSGIPVVSGPLGVLDTGIEVADLLTEHGIGRIRRPVDRHLTVLESLDEAEAWLRDTRTYEDKFHNRPWESMRTDVANSMKARGTRLTAATPSLDTLAIELQNPQLGPNELLREPVLRLIASSRTELAKPVSAIAALDDLISAAGRPNPRKARLEGLTLTLRDCLLCGGHSAASVFGLLADALRNTTIGVKTIQNIMGDDVRFARDDILTGAGLSLRQRLDLCHRLLDRPHTSASEVVWLCFANARIRPHIVDFGPFTFYDKRDLTQAYNSPEKDLVHVVNHPDGSSGFRLEPRPSEFPRANDEKTQYNWPEWPPDIENWVMVRVHLGPGPTAEPIQEARRQVAKVVSTAAFYGNGTSWQLQDGYVFLRDEACLGHTGRWESNSVIRFVADKTDFIVQDLEPALASHFPLSDPLLQDILNTINIVNEHRDDLDGASLLHSVRAIETVAGLCGFADWDKYLTTNFATRWARDQVMHVVSDAVLDALNVEPHLRLPSVPTTRDLYTARGEFRVSIAARAIPRLCSEAPPRHPAARTLRQAAALTASPERLLKEVRRLEDEYKVLVERMHRCRNSLTHAGPFRETTARTVLSVARKHAKEALDTALRATLDNTKVKKEQERRREIETQWRDSILSLTDITEAFG